ncbi:hypothetical protein HYU13_03570 [Candidatus Woesearchaeota archaeon]|nr:hypothetical protein [Candidatus Woesearchaeota archaeon]
MSLEHIVKKDDTPKIMVLGNHTWDDIWEFDRTDKTSFTLEDPSEAIDDYVAVDERGGLSFKPDVVLGIKHEGKWQYYDPVDKALLPGAKSNSVVSDAKPENKRVLKPRILFLSAGGGGYHLAEAINAVSTIPLQYIGPCHANDLLFEHQLNAKGIRDHIFLAYLGKTLGIGKGTLVVNSIKDVNLGRRAIDEAVAFGDVGIIAMTPSSKRELLDYAVGKSFIPVFSDEDIEKYTGIRVNEFGWINYHACVDALHQVRSRQRELGGEKTRIYLTLGKEGSICLDEHDVIHRMECYFAKGERNNTGAGDAFAAAVAMQEHLCRYEPGKDDDAGLDIDLTLQFGSAMARTKLAEKDVDPAIVNNTLECNHINFRGPLAFDSIIPDENAGSLLSPDALRNVKSHTSLNRILGRYSRINPERR